MKRRLLAGAGALLIVSCLGVALGLGWLLQTSAGVRWLLRAISQNSAVQVSAKTVSGSLISAVKLEGVTARWPVGELAVADLRLRCNPLLLPFGTLAIRELTLKGVQFHDHSLPRTAGPDFIWPRVIGLPSFFAARINQLTITDISYQERQQPPVVLPNVTATVGWHDARFSLTNLSLKTGGGQLTGAITAGFASPALDSDLSFTPQRPVAGCNQIKLQTRLKPGLAAEQVAGDINMTAMAGKRMRYTLHGAMGLSRNALHLHGMNLSESGRNGSLKAEGDIALSGESRLQLQLNRLELTQELGQAMTLSGNVALTGGTTQYTGRLDLATSGAGWRSSRINGDFSGDKNSIALSKLNAALLSGTADGSIRVDWQDGVTVQSSLHGRGLNPAHFDPAWNGTVNFDLHGSATWSGGGLSQAKAYGRLRDSRLRGKVLRGEIAAQLKNNDLQIDRLLLAGNGFAIQAAGLLNQRLDLTANISDLAGLIPQTKGQLALKGWGRYAAGIASGQLSGQGSNLVADGLRINSATLSAGLRAGAERTLHGNAELHGLQFQGIKVDNVSLQADGLLAQHRLAMTLGSAGAVISGQINGGYAAGQWQGELTALSGHDLVGPWQLTTPARLAISAQTVTISPLTITGLPGEHAELAGTLQLKPFQVAAQAGWHDLKLARIDQWLLATRLAGQTSGEVAVKLFNTNRLIVKGNANGTGTITRANHTIGLTKAHLDLDAGQGGTTATVELSTDGGASFSGRFNSAEPAILARPTQGELHAAWNGIDAMLVKRWLPQNLDLQGRLAGQLTGTLLPEQRFALCGTIGLADGELQWDHHGQPLQAAVKTAGLTWHWRGDSLSGQVALAAGDAGEATGTFQLPLPAQFDRAIEPTGPVKATFSGRLQERGMFATIFPGQLQHTSGLLEVALQAGGTWQAPTLSGELKLTQAGAYLPATGVQLANLSLTANLASLKLARRRPGEPVRANLAFSAGAAAVLTRDTQTITFDHVLLDLNAGEQGLAATLEIKTAAGVTAHGRFSSPDPAMFAIPAHGTFNGSWDGLEAKLAKPWLPPGLDLQGRLAGGFSGHLLPDKNLDLSGTVTLTDGIGRWREAGQELTAAVRTSALTWSWRGDSLSGDLALQLAKFGEAKGSFTVPLKARLGALPDPAGPIKGTLQGKFQEQGILTALFPGLLQETKGLLDVHLTAAGTWQQPAVYGTMGLSQAEAYLPAAGIRLADIRLAARLDGTLLQVESFQVTSGSGMLAGTAEFSFAGKKLAGYHGTLHGKGFQAIHLPELQLVVDPELTFTGDWNRLAARGQITVPELRLNSQAAAKVIMPSSDIVVLNQKLPAATSRGPQLDLQLNILLGDQVVVKNEGLDARLVGSINLQQTAPAGFTGRGEITVAKGNYRIYGVNLDIKRGRAIFSGGPVERPTLDILAVREVDEVKAGVTVTGTPEAPLIKLYSEPTLPDTDILSYLVLGQKMGESGQQTALLMQAASLLGSSNQTTDLQGQLKKLVGLDTIKISSGKEPNVGYKPIESTLRANPQGKTDSKAISQSMLQLGKYLTPKLYVSYGRSLFDESQQLRARYAISKQWEIESKVSQQATGGDLFFRIELD